MERIPKFLTKSVGPGICLFGVSCPPGADPRKNAWSGIHTRLSAEIITREQQVDGVIVWDMVCGTIGKTFPKVAADESRKNVYVAEIAAAVYLSFPATIPHPRSNPAPVAQALASVEFLQALHTCFKGKDEEVNFVDFQVGYKGTDTVRKTIVRRNGTIQAESGETTIRLFRRNYAYHSESMAKTLAAIETCPFAPRASPFGRQGLFCGRSVFANAGKWCC